jgi:hypothetical protein
VGEEVNKNERNEIFCELCHLKPYKKDEKYQGGVLFFLTTFFSSLYNSTIFFLCNIDEEMEMNDGEYQNNNERCRN